MFHDDGFSTVSYCKNGNGFSPAVIFKGFDWTKYSSTKVWSQRQVVQMYKTKGWAPQRKNADSALSVEWRGLSLATGNRATPCPVSCTKETRNQYLDKWLWSTFHTLSLWRLNACCKLSWVGLFDGLSWQDLTLCMCVCQCACAFCRFLLVHSAHVGINKFSA